MTKPKWVLVCFVYSTVSFAQAEDKWVADEIFLQMSEMRKEIQQLQQRVAGLESMTLGKASATIGILEFSDYQCPFCGKHYQNVLPKLKEKYIDKGIVSYVLKDFPLDFHSHAKKASLAARCAGEQKHYWDMHNAVFEARGVASDEVMVKVAKRQKLDLAALKHCMDDPKQLAKVEQDINLGAQLGVQGTPAFVIGRIKDKQLVDYQRYDGMQPLENFVRIIDSYKN